MKRTILFGFLRLNTISCALLVIAPLNSNAATWNNSTGDCCWFNTDNWNNQTCPSSADGVTFTNMGSPYVVYVDGGQSAVTQSLSANTSMNLVIKDNSTLEINKTTDAGHLGYFGYDGATNRLTIENGSTFYISGKNGKSRSKNMLIFGQGTGSMGIVDIHEGATFKTVTGSSSFSGAYYGVASFGNGGGTGIGNVRGSLQADNLSVGNNGGTGIINVGKGGDDDTDPLSTIANVTGTYALHIGNINSTGTMNVYSGTVTGNGLGNFTVGTSQNSVGYLNIYGGIVNSGSYFKVGSETGSKGYVEMNDGTLSITTAYLGYSAASGAYGATEGTMVIKGGTVNITTLYVGRQGKGTLDIATNTAVLNHKTTAGALTSITNSGGEGVVKFTYTDGASMSFNNKMAGTKLRVEHRTNGTTTLGGDSTYQDGTYIYAGTVVGAHNKALGNGILYVKGGTFTLDSTVNTLSTGGVNMTSGMINLMDGKTDLIGLTGSLELTGGSLHIDILSDAAFDSFTSSSGGLLTLMNGTLNLSGFGGFEGTIGQSGNTYAIFSGFAALGAEIVDGEGTLTINGYDKSKWIAKIDTAGNLVFETNPIPETTTATLGLLGLAGMLLRRRKA